MRAPQTLLTPLIALAATSLMLPALRAPAAERERALRALKALARPGTTGGDEAAHRYAELCLRFHREKEKLALAEAEKAFEDLRKNSGSRWGLRGQLGLWRVAALKGRRAEAVRNLDRFLGRNTRCERAVEAAYHLGRICAAKQHDLAELKSAERALCYALQLHKSVAKYTPPIVEAKTIAAELKRVRRRIWELQAGRLRVLFERAEKLRRAKKFGAAILLYRDIRKQFPGHDLAELAGLRVAECCFAKKELKRAVNEAREFVARNPLGAYRGHAHVLIGDVHLEHFFDVAGAEPEFRCVLDPKRRPRWVDAERRRLIAYRKVDEKKSPPAKSAHATWKQVLHSAHERAGILEYLRRDYRRAAAHFASSQKLKPNKTYGDNPHQGMAELAEKIRAKREIIPPVMLAERAERPKLVLLLASLYMAGWRDQRSMTLLRRVAAGEFKEASLNQRAYAEVKIAEGLFYKIKDEEAVKVLKKFRRKPYATTSFAPRALIQLSVVTNRLDRWDESIVYLDECHARFPNTDWGRLALFQKAYAYYAKAKCRTAMKLFDDYVAKYPNSFAVKAGHIKYYMRVLKTELAGEKKEK